MLNQLSDEQLMSAFCDPNDINHQRAFEALYQRHKGPLYRFINQSVNQPQDVNELFQDLWLRVINHKHQFDPQKSFTTWVYTIARRLMIDLFRKLGRSQLEPLADESSLADVSLQLPDDVFTQQKLQDHLKQAIAVLPDIQKQVLLMKLDGGLSIPNIAEIIEQPLEQTKSQYRYAVRKVKLALERVL
jgi:RNA polymerase sigma-70 factor (ECF subfamily)